jgi:hypothetical protein
MQKNTLCLKVILSVKEVNSKARIASLKLLVDIGETFIRCSDQSKQGMRSPSQEKDLVFILSLKGKITFTSVQQIVINIELLLLIPLFFLACIETYLGTLVAGFGGSPNMVSGTIIAISKIVYEYRGIGVFPGLDICNSLVCLTLTVVDGVIGSYSTQVLDQLIKTMTNLLMSNKREIVKTTLGFFKVRLCNIFNNQ